MPVDEPGLPREHHLTITRAARYFMLGTPSKEVRECWFVLHGYGQLAGNFIRRFAPVERPDRLIVAPEALSRFYLGNRPGRHAQSRVGASWMTREDRLAEISDQVGYLDALWTRVAEALEREAVPLCLLGFSQGAATASRWTTLGGAPVSRLVLWAGAVPDDLDLGQLRHRLGGAPVEFVAGRDDDFLTHDLLAAQVERLRARDQPCTVHTFDGGHVLESDTLALLMQ